MDPLLPLAGRVQVEGYTRKTKTGKTVRVSAYSRSLSKMSLTDLVKELKSFSGDLSSEDRTRQSQVINEMRRRKAPGLQKSKSAGAGMDAVIAARKGSGRQGSATASGSLEDPINVKGNVVLAAKLLAEGKHVRLNRVDQVGTLLDQLAKQVQEAKDKGEKAPTYNLCLVSVPKTNLFCAESKGVPRTKMPQLAGVPRKGSKADALERNKRGRVDVSDQFEQELIRRGVTVESKQVKAEFLKASQAELDGPKVGGLLHAMEQDEYNEVPIFVTRDGYVIDGHHRWAAKVAFDSEDGKLGDIKLPVRMIDMEIGEALDFANEFSKEMGLPQVGIGANANPKLDAGQGKSKVVAMSSSTEKLVPLAGDIRVRSHNRHSKTGQVVHVDSYYRSPRLMSAVELLSAISDSFAKIKSGGSNKDKNYHNRLISEAVRRQKTGQLPSHDPVGPPRANTDYDTVPLKTMSANDLSRNVAESITRVYREGDSSPRALAFHRKVMDEWGDRTSRGDIVLTSKGKHTRNYPDKDVSAMSDAELLAEADAQSQNVIRPRPGSPDPLWEISMELHERGLAMPKRGSGLEPGRDPDAKHVAPPIGDKHLHRVRNDELLKAAPGVLGGDSPVDESAREALTKEMIYRRLQVPGPTPDPDSELPDPTARRPFGVTGDLGSLPPLPPAPRQYAESYDSFRPQKMTGRQLMESINDSIARTTNAEGQDPRAKEYHSRLMEEFWKRRERGTLTPPYGHQIREYLLDREENPEPLEWPISTVPDYDTSEPRGLSDWDLVSQLSDAFERIALEQQFPTTQERLDTVADRLNQLRWEYERRTNDYGGHFISPDGDAIGAFLWQAGTNPNPKVWPRGFKQERRGPIQWSPFNTLSDEDIATFEELVSSRRYARGMFNMARDRIETGAADREEIDSLIREMEKLPKIGVTPAPKDLPHFTDPDGFLASLRSAKDEADAADPLVQDRKQAADLDADLADDLAEDESLSAIGKLKAAVKEKFGNRNETGSLSFPIKPPPATKPLTPRQAAFIKKLLNERDGNAEEFNAIEEKIIIGAMGIKEASSTIDALLELPLKPDFKKYATPKQVSFIKKLAKTKDMDSNPYLPDMIQQALDGKLEIGDASDLIDVLLSKEDKTTVDLINRLKTDSAPPEKKADSPDSSPNSTVQALRDSLDKLGIPEPTPAERKAELLSLMANGSLTDSEQKRLAALRSWFVKNDPSVLDSLESPAKSESSPTFAPSDNSTLLKQIGSQNVLAISGGRVLHRETGVTLPVSHGYSVKVDLASDDTYTVQRVFTRSGVESVKGVVSGVHADQVGNIAYRAGSFQSYKPDEIAG